MQNVYNVFIQSSFSYLKEYIVSLPLWCLCRNLGRHIYLIRDCLQCYRQPQIYTYLVCVALYNLYHQSIQYLRGQQSMFQMILQISDYYLSSHLTNYFIRNTSYVTHTQVTDEISVRGFQLLQRNVEIATINASGIGYNV